MELEDLPHVIDACFVDHRYPALLLFLLPLQLDWSLSLSVKQGFLGSIRTDQTASRLGPSIAIKRASRLSPYRFTRSLATPQ